MCVYSYIYTHVVYILFVSRVRACSQACFLCSSQSVCSASILSWFKILLSLPFRVLSWEQLLRKRGSVWISNAVKLSKLRWPWGEKTQGLYCVISDCKTDDGAGPLFCQEDYQEYFCLQKIVETWSSIKILSRKKSDAKSSHSAGYL